MTQINTKVLRVYVVSGLSCDFTSQEIKDMENRLAKSLRDRELPTAIEVLETLVSFYENKGDIEKHIFNLVDLATCRALNGELEVATEIYEKAYRLFVGAENAYHAPHVLYHMAQHLSRKGNFDNARELYDRAVSVAKRENDKKAEIMALSGLAHVDCQENKPNDAIDKLKLAHEMAWEYDEFVEWYRTGVNLLRLYLQRRGPTSELKSVMQKLVDLELKPISVGEKFDAILGRVEFLSLLAQVYSEEGDHLEVTKILQSLREIATSTPNPIVTSKVYETLGWYYLRTGNLGEALKFLIEAKSALAPLEDDHSSAGNLLNLGLLFEHVLHFGQADECFDKAHVVFKKFGDSRGMAYCLNNKAQIARKIRKREEALDLLKQSYALLQNVKDIKGMATALASIGHVMADWGDYKKARDHYNEALALGPIDHQLSAAVTVSIAKVERHLGNAQGALDHAGKALAEFRTVSDVEGEAYALEELGRIYENIGDAETAHNYYAESIGLNEQIRQTLTEPWSRGGFRRDKLESFDRAINICLTLYNETKDGTWVDKAFLHAKQAKAALLRDRASGFFRRMETRGTVLTIDSIKSHLFDRKNPCGLLLDFYMTKTSIIVFFLRKDYVHVKFSRIRMPVQQVAMTIFKPETEKASCTSSDIFDLDDSDAAILNPKLPRSFRWLSKLIMEKIHRHLKREELTVIFPHSYLHLVPWAALFDDESKEFLIEICPLAILPYVDVRRNKGEGRADFSVFGDPYNPTDADYPSLKYARSEASSIANLLEVTPLLGTDVTIARFADALSHSGVVHVACHGGFNLANWKDCGIKLYDGFFGIEEFAKTGSLRGLSLVTLSCCESGLRFPDKTDDMDSIVWLLLGAGVDTVLASLWKVDDSSTAHLMMEFYQNWLDRGMSKVQALRKAQLRFVRATSHPYFWAAFQLWGEWG